MLLKFMHLFLASDDSSMALGRNSSTVVDYWVDPAMDESAAKWSVIDTIMFDFEGNFKRQRLKMLLKDALVHYWNAIALVAGSFPLPSCAPR